MLTEANKKGNEKTGRTIRREAKDEKTRKEVTSKARQTKRGPARQVQPVRQDQARKDMLRQTRARFDKTRQEQDRERKRLGTTSQGQTRPKLAG